MAQAGALLPPRRYVAQPRSPLSVGADIFTFAVGASALFVIHVVGDLPVADILTLSSCLVLAFFMPRRLLRPSLHPIFILLAVWLIGQIATDMYRESPFEGWARNDARIIFLGLNILFFSVVVGRSVRRQVIFFASYAIGGIAQAFLQPSELTRADPWKFGYASAVITLVLLTACFFYKYRRYSIVIALIVGVIGVNLLFNYRSPILFLLVTIMLVVPVIPEKIGQVRLLPRNNSKARLFVLSLMALTAGLAAQKIVSTAARSGLLGQGAKEKDETQSNAKGGLLLGGRSEILVSSIAVYDSPFLGHGSGAQDRRYTELYNDLRVENGIQEKDVGEDEDSSESIPTHSHLMGAWVDAGILGALFWGFTVYFVTRGIIRTALIRPALSPVYAAWLVSYVWAIGFSPMGSITHIPEAFMIVLVSDLLDFTKLPGTNLVKLRPRKRSNKIPRISFATRRWN